MLALVALLAAFAQAPSTDVARIDVIARDAQGRPVETLNASDIELREDGTPQTLTGVQLMGGPRLVGIYLDEYFVSASKTAAVKAALHRFVDEDLASGDQVAILRPLDSLLAITLTGDRAAMHRAIDAFEGRRGNYEARTDFEKSLVASDRSRADSQRAQSTWSTLNALALHLANLNAGRSSLLLVSEQADVVFRRRGLESLPSSSSITRTANRSNVSIYVFNPRGAAEQAASPEDGLKLLRVLADDSDGALFSGVDAADAGLRQMLSDASSYYMVSYATARNRDGVFHSIEVRVKRAGVKVRARKGYWAPTPDEVQRARLLTNGGTTLPPIKLEPPRHASTLIRPWFGLARGDNGRIRMTFVWEASGPVPGDRRVKIPARLEVKAVGSDGKLAFEGTVSDRSSAVFDVPPGRVTLTSSVEDSASQTIDSDVRDVIVRDLTGAVVLGTPEVFRARTARDMRDIRDDASAIPVAAREFSRAEELLIRVPAYPSVEPPTVSATLISPAAQPMRQMVVQSVSPAGLPQIELPLAALPPGLYTLEIAAKAEAGAAKETVKFRVTN